MNREMLTMLRKQQERQVRIVWAALAIVFVAFMIVGAGMYLTYNSFERMNESFNQYISTTGGLTYETDTQDSQGLSP